MVVLYKMKSRIWNISYRHMAQDRNNPNGPKVHGVVGAKELWKQYDLTFSQKNLHLLLR